MSNPTALAVLFLTVGVISVLRAVAIIATSGRGRIPFDSSLSLLFGFACILLGQALVD